MTNESIGYSAITERAVEPEVIRESKNKTEQKQFTVFEGDPLYGAKLGIANERLCKCGHTHINCMSPKDWLKSQIGVWQFFYESRDIRDKSVHPATFPISLAKKVIELFTHQGQLVIDPFVGSGTSLIAANDLNRNAVGFDLQKKYVELCANRIQKNPGLFNTCSQMAVQDDARNIAKYISPNTVSLIWTSPPYANLLNRARKNKSRRDRNNEQIGKVEQYSQDVRDLGTMSIDSYAVAMGDIFEGLLPLKE